ncbi:hypothetical protein L3X38_035624 [Prunus dulcis]|uniref:Uncharacterized protein n=1 Tax=Prunus dulcis TaxID=3755 RepID=A0AAD4VK23_PRUDU|nr:hypothetical protein L3X38_035624 [Prunus dulcis]
MHNPQVAFMRDALAKHKPDCCSLGPTKALEEKELLALAANKDISSQHSGSLGWRKFTDQGTVVAVEKGI